MLHDQLTKTEKFSHKLQTNMQNTSPCAALLQTKTLKNMNRMF